MDWIHAWGSHEDQFLPSDWECDLTNYSLLTLRNVALSLVTIDGFTLMLSCMMDVNLLKRSMVRRIHGSLHQGEMLGWSHYLSINCQAKERSPTICIVIRTSSLMLMVRIIWWRNLRVSARNWQTCRFDSNWWNSWTCHINTFN